MSAPPFDLKPTAAVFAGQRTAVMPSGGGVPAAGMPRRSPPGSGSAPAPARSSRRTRLHELPAYLHCSIVGTCLGLNTLRKFVSRHAAVDGTCASDHDVHHAGVDIASKGGDAARALSKLLDHEHAATIRQYARARSEAELEALWRGSVSSGEVPAGYWAVMSHPLLSPALRSRVFGDVHMLSHLVGRASRADLRRLAALEAANEALREKADSQQRRMHQQHLSHRQELMRLQARIEALAASAAGTTDSELAAENVRLRAAMSERDTLVALHASRREHCERTLAAVQGRSDELEARWQKSLDIIRTLQHELAALERVCLPESATASDRPALGRLLRGRRLLYVGGRPSSNVALRALVAHHGGSLTIHDGGLEDRKGLLAAAVGCNEAVYFPVDCVDHDSVSMLKRTCERMAKPFVPLRSASVSCFVRALLDADPGAARGDHAAASSFCLRNG